MHFLSVFSLRNRALIALVTIVVGIFGSIALTTLKQELIPSVTFPQLVVVTSYPGASPEVVNQDVSTPIEEAVQGVAGLEDTSATSNAGLSSISASFTYGTDLITAEQKVSQAINRIKSTLPTGVDPRVITGSIDDLPVIQIAVTSDLSATDLSDLLATATLADIRQLDGVREADLLGTTVQRVMITPDRDALAGRGSRQPGHPRRDRRQRPPAPRRVDHRERPDLSPCRPAPRLGSVQDIAALPAGRACRSTARSRTIADVATVTHRRRPGHRHLAGQRRARR